MLQTDPSSRHPQAPLGAGGVLPSERHRPGGSRPRAEAHRRQVRRSVWWSVALYTAAIAALTLLPGWLMLR